MCLGISGERSWILELLIVYQNVLIVEILLAFFNAVRDWDTQILHTDSTYWNTFKCKRLIVVRAAVFRRVSSHLLIYRLYTSQFAGLHHDMPVFSVLCHLNRHLVSCHILFHQVSPSQLWSASISLSIYCHLQYLSRGLTLISPLHMSKPF